MDLSELNLLMKNREFTLHSSSGSNAWYDYVDNMAIHCTVYIKSKVFAFDYATPNMFMLKSGNIGSIENKKHFDMFYKKFKHEVYKLEESL